MYDELKEKCRACSQGCNSPSECSYFDKPPLWCMRQLLSDAADAIEEMQDTVQAQDKALKQCADQLARRWILVTERLPKTERKSYWVCTDTGYQCECRWTNNRFGIGESDKWGWSIFDIPQYQKVVAWMPLPKPYEPPKEE